MAAISNIMIITIPSEAKKRIEKIYNEMDSKEKLCLHECSKCCIDNIEMTYIEFAYLIKGISEEELRDLFSEDRKNRCIFLKDGRCIAYERRPWICRNFRRFPETGNCGSERVHEGEITDNFLSEMDITGLNNEIAPKKFRNMKKTMNSWYSILIKNNKC